MNIKELIDALQAYPIETEVGLSIGGVDDNFSEPTMVFTDLTNMEINKEGDYLYLEGSLPYAEGEN